MTIATIMTQIEDIDKLVSECLEMDADRDKQVSILYTKLAALCKYANEYKLFLLMKEVNLR